MGVNFDPIFGSANVYSGTQFSRGTHASKGFPFPGGQIPLGGFSQLEGNRFTMGLPYPGSNHEFLISLSNVSPHMVRPYGPTGLNTMLPLDHNPFSNMQFPFLSML